MRIVSLVPSQTELLFYLGLDEEVVGITKFCVHPPDQWRKKTRVGGTKSVNLDKVRELAPTLIIANIEENEKDQIEALQEEFEVWVSDVKNLSDALVMIKRVGEMVGKKQAARNLCAELDFRFTRLKRQMRGRKKRAAYFIWRDPWLVSGYDTFIHDMLDRAGYINVFRDMDRYPEVSLEELVAAKPDEILLSSEPYPFKEKHVAEIKEACPNAEVYLVDGELFSWYGNRLLYSVAYFLEKKYKK